MQSTGNHGNQQVTKVCDCCWFCCNLQQSHPNRFYDAALLPQKHIALTCWSLLYCWFAVLWIMSHATLYHSNSSSREPAVKSNCRLSSSWSCKVTAWGFPYLPFFTTKRKTERPSDVWLPNFVQTLRNQDLVDVYTNPNAVMTHLVQTELKPQKNAQDWTKLDDAAV